MFSNVDNNTLANLVHDQQSDTSLVIGNWRLFFRMAVLLTIISQVQLTALI